MMMAEVIQILPLHLLQKMVKDWHIALIILTLLCLGEAWVLCGDTMGQQMAIFMDRKTHGVSWWWFIKNLSDQLLTCALTFFLAIICTECRPRLSYFFLVLFLYFTLCLFIWLYNYSTKRSIFYIMLLALDIWAIIKYYPFKKKMRVV